MRGTSYDPIKRVIDIVGATAGLVVLSPVLALVAGLIRTKLGTPVLFRQQRPGKDGEAFTIYKFRTMTEGEGSDEDRLTPLGRTLRSTSLDELPELLNILTGDMSLVGPRPLLVEYLDRYTPEQARRHEVRPGLTGLAQVQGRNDTTWEDRLRLDVHYVDNRSLALDARILTRTIGMVLRRSGIAHTGTATMPRFENKNWP